MLTGRMNKLPEAIDAYKRAVAIKPDLLETYSNLSWTYDKLGRYPEAADAYKQVIRLKPDDAEANNNMGYALGKSKRWQEALVAFSARFNSSRITPRLTATWVGPTTIWELTRAAVEPLKKSIQLKPSLPEGHFNLGLSYFSLEAEQRSARRISTDDSIEVRLARSPE